jgi:hypothetical protein
LLPAGQRSVRDGSLLRFGVVVEGELGEALPLRQTLDLLSHLGQADGVGSGREQNHMLGVPRKGIHAWRDAGGRETGTAFSADTGAGTAETGHDMGEDVLGRERQRIEHVHCLSVLAECEKRKREAKDRFGPLGVQAGPKRPSGKMKGQSCSVLSGGRGCLCRWCGTKSAAPGLCGSEEGGTRRVSGQESYSVGGPITRRWGTDGKDLFSEAESGTGAAGLGGLEGSFAKCGPRIGGIRRGSGRRRP